jgi:GR25 family glycosyltransferase involved in LPS biosynthesis
MLTRVIAVTQLGQGVHSKFAKRNLHVRNTLIPSLAQIGLSAEIFPAIIGSSVKVSGGAALHDSLEIPLGEGCIGNLLSNYELWKLSVTTGQSVLILEDDAILPPQNAQFVADAIRSFQQSHQDQPDILYLLSQSPFIKDTFKRYAPSELKVINSSISRLIRTSDLACTAAYMVTPFSARRLMERITKSKTIPTDGYVHTAQRDGTIGIVVQTDPTKGFMLNENWAEWNHKHDPSVKMEPS